MPPALKVLSLSIYNTALIPFFLFMAKLWWLWLFLFFSILAKNLWQWWRISMHKKNLQWSLLEILIPREVRKSPKGMEQVLNQIYSLRNTPENFIERYWDGEVTYWWSLEISHFDDETHFYVRTLSKYRNIIEAQLYSNYKDVEIVEVDDYVNRLPAKTDDLYKMGMDLFGLELSLGREGAYPFKTYMQFESSIEEEKSLDPISGLLEVLSKLKKEEYLWLQILIKPEDPLWKEKGYKIVEKLKQKASSRVDIGGKTLFSMRTPGETDIMEAIEKNIAKAPFEVIVRYIYMAPRSIFSRQTPYRGVRSAFAQYSTQDMNYFVPNIAARTMVWWIRFPFFFPKKREEAKKQRLLLNYRQRAMVPEMKIGQILNSQIFYFDKKSKPVVISSEGIATLFHPPTYLILTAPFIKRTEAKRLGPPAGLQIFGGDDLELPGLAPEEKKKK